MLNIRRSKDRGHANHGWLDTYHSFSFAGYYDPDRMGFRDLRVINEDRIAGGGGFGTHGHKDMEIITYVLDGALEHRDSLGTGSVIRPGEIQKMSAGTGILHSEYNGSPSQEVHLLQIWLLPAQKGIAPGYEQKETRIAEKPGQLHLIAGPAPGTNAVKIHQDVNLYAGIIEPGETLTHKLDNNRHAWVQIARGAIAIDNIPLEAGDGIAISGESGLTITATERAEILLFDLN
ncbi:MAG: Quercetin 2,3-dioxygenase [Chroococcopsis gigantea SAG 12.99]|jgi:redox-sensitive bicupin YhaK (pirin superfamily)|nr:pirin family protein [Chlorogloea purpurea SAG 13.99]MDV2999629.1 Quercetin 2,3-dioxygenase [Chroococcopsis gigantea SAG 12.99]